jgi:hypothetical protein
MDHNADQHGELMKRSTDELKTEASKTDLKEVSYASNEVSCGMAEAC